MGFSSMLKFGSKFLKEGGEKLFRRGAKEAAEEVAEHGAKKVAEAAAGEVAERGAKKVAEEGAKKVAEQGFVSGLKSGAGQMAGKAAAVGGVWAGANILGADGEGFEKVSNGLAAMGEQVTGAAKLGKSVLGLGSSAATAIADVADAASSGDLLGGLGNMVSGFMGKISEMVPENLRGFILPAALAGGALMFGNSGIIGKVAIAGIATAAFMGNAGGIQDVAKSLIGGLGGNEAMEAAMESGMQSASDGASMGGAPGAEPVAPDAMVAGQELAMA